MKFADKLFFAMTGLLTIIFAVFGIWMLSSYFQNLVNREAEQGLLENQMVRVLFQMAYRSAEEYGDDYAIPKAIDAAAMNHPGNQDSLFFALSQDMSFYYGENAIRKDAYRENIIGIVRELSDDRSCAYGIRKMGEEYYLISVCCVRVREGFLYLGLCRDVSDIYRDREHLMNQYRLALVLLLVAGSVCIYVVLRYITSPIRKLGRTARNIADGNLEVRSNYRSPDEIGTLAESFDSMADKLVENMKEIEKEARNKEKEARQKEEFTASFAHELKTPLTSIIGYADMLNSIELSEEERREAYFYIFSQGKRLESLSHKLLELAEMENNPLTVRPVSTRILEEDLRATMRPIFRRKQIKGKITMEKGVIYGDQELLLSLFYNLLDNAVKAVEEQGFILLKGTCLSEGYEVKVVDNGRGIPKQEIGRITEAFYMVDKSRSRKEGGAGIGMALCQKVITLHGGTLTISSKEGDGTVMRMLFPGKLSQDGFRAEMTDKTGMTGNEEADIG
ncbi:MAG: HAMP domain-containing histidine kinase [Lachnospiraceae bacterium]|nr:HAMP domain-containing histidine kinase [Lachnospiraceae bacterium]